MINNKNRGLGSSKRPRHKVQEDNKLKKDGQLSTHNSRSVSNNWLSIPKSKRSYPRYHIAISKKHAVILEPETQRNAGSGVPIQNKPTNTEDGFHERLQDPKQ